MTIFDAIGAGTGATATAAVASGGVTAINVTAGGTGYLTGGGIKKFQDPLPGLYDSARGGPERPPSTSRSAVPEAKTYADPNGKKIIADEYEIALVQYRTNFSSSMPEGALVRGYVQLETPSERLAQASASTTR